MKGSTGVAFALLSDRAAVHGSPSGGARFQAGLHLRRNTQLSLYNSLIAAFPIGLIIENDKNSTTQTWATEGKLNVKNCIIAGAIKNFQDAQNSDPVINPNDAGTFANTYFTAAANGNRIIANIAGLGLSGNPLTLTALNAFPQSGSPLLTGATTLSGFDAANYIGAFGPSETAANNWATGWTNFDPQNTDY